MRAHVAIAALAFLASAAAFGAIQGREVEYEAGGTSLKGYLAYDDAHTGRRPAILVVHEWWGHDEHARESARRLAEAGYVGFALDMYGEGKQAHHPEDAGKFARDVYSNMQGMRARFAAAREYLQQQSIVDPARLGAIGYCFGGGVVLEMARAGEDLRGVVSFHGSLDTPAAATPGAVQAQVLVLTGGADPFVPKEQVETFEREMDAAGAKYRVVTYPGVQHSFTNPQATENGKKFNLPLEYNAAAAKQSWSEALEFFEQVMK